MVMGVDNFIACRSPTESDDEVNQRVTSKHSDSGNRWSIQLRRGEKTQLTSDSFHFDMILPCRLSEV